MKYVRDDHFDTLTAAIEAAQATAEWRRKGFAQAESSPSTGRWSGGTHEQTAKWATEGWKEGVARARTRAERIATRLVGTSGITPVMDFTADVTGGCYDVGAYVAGEPECWLRLEPSVSKRAITIGTCIAVSAAVSNEVTIARGIAVSALVMALQAAGYPVTIEVTSVAIRWSGTGDAESMTVRVADASTGSQLDLDRVVFAMAHPTMNRVLIRCLTAGDAANGGALWDRGRPQADTIPPGRAYDLYLGGIGYNEAARWQDPDAWIVSEYIRLTGGAQ